jgi:hypothetical protein
MSIRRSAPLHAGRSRSRACFKAEGWGGGVRLMLKFAAMRVTELVSATHVPATSAGDIDTVSNFLKKLPMPSRHARSLWPRDPAHLEYGCLPREDLARSNWKFEQDRQRSVSLIFRGENNEAADLR